MPFSRVLVFLSLGLLTAVFLPSCLELSKKYAERRAYRVDTTRGAKRVDTVFKGVLRISPFRVPTSFEILDLVYRIDDNEFETDYYNEYLTLPGDMVTAEIQEWFAASGVFSHVVAAGSQVEGDYVLEGTVPAFYADLRQRAASRAVVKIQVFLLSGSADTAGEILFSRDYVSEAPFDEVSAANYVQAASVALGNVLRDLERDLIAQAAVLAER